MLAEAKRASAFSYSVVLEPDPRSPIQFSDHADCDGVLFFKHAAELGLEGIVSKRTRSTAAVLRRIG
jgi:ATP-dependent DNA ligase